MGIAVTESHNSVFFSMFGLLVPINHFGVCLAKFIKIFCKQLVSKKLLQGLEDLDLILILLSQLRFT